MQITDSYIENINFYFWSSNHDTEYKIIYHICIEYNNDK